MSENCLAHTLTHVSIQLTNQPAIHPSIHLCVEQHICIIDTQQPKSPPINNMPASVSMIFILFQHMTKRKLLPKRNDKSCMASMSIKFMQEFPVQINPSSIDRMKRKEKK